MKIKKRIPRKKEGPYDTEDLQGMLKDIESKSIGFFEKYRIPVIIAVIASVIVIAGAISYKLFASYRNNNAVVIEYRAYNYFL